MEGIDDKVAQEVLTRLQVETAEDSRSASEILNALISSEKIAIDAVNKISTIIHERGE
jgi:hypothetical protein